MNNNTSWGEVFITLGFGVFLIILSLIFLSFTNPRIEAKCAERGGQVLVRPGQVSSCLYPAK
jgi:hypothetical protein